VGIGADLNWSGKFPRPLTGFEIGSLDTFTNINGCINISVVKPGIGKSMLLSANEHVPHSQAN